MSNWDMGNLEGLIPLLGGIYGYLLANGTLPRKPKDPEKMALWRRKFGPMMKIIGPILVVFGILQLLGVL
jgi:hypothetical protein